MAQFDSSMYRGVPAIDLSQATEGFERGMKLGDMVRQRKSDALMKEAYQQGVTQNPDGSTTFNAMKVGDFLNQNGMARESQEFQAKQQQKALEEQKLNFEKQGTKILGGYQLMNTVKDQRTLENARREALSLGYTQDEIDQNLPSVYDEKTIGFVREQLGQASIPYAQKIENQRKAQEAALRLAETQQNNDFRRQEVGLRRQERQDVQQAKMQEKQEKKNSAVTEIQDRYLNIMGEIENLGSLIDKDGTYNVMGPQNEIIDQKITSIATDMAKLVDPTSVARESEVAAFKKMLFSPTPFIQDSTAKDVLGSFKKMVEDRLSTAYKVRGLDGNQSVISKTKKEETNNQKPKKIIQNGVTYELNPQTGEYE